LKRTLHQILLQFLNQQDKIKTDQIVRLQVASHNIKSSEHNGDVLLISSFGGTNWSPKFRRLKSPIGDWIYKKFDQRRLIHNFK